MLAPYRLGDRNARRLRSRAQHPSAQPQLPSTAGLEDESVAARRVGWEFIALYTLAFISTSLLFLAPLLVTLALKVNPLVGIEQAPSSLAVVTGTAPCWRWWGTRSSAR